MVRDGGGKSRRGLRSRGGPASASHPLTTMYGSSMELCGEKKMMSALSRKVTGRVRASEETGPVGAGADLEPIGRALGLVDLWRNREQSSCGMSACTVPLTTRIERDEKEGFSLQRRRTEGPVANMRLEKMKEKKKEKMKKK